MQGEIDALAAENGFSGVVTVDRGDETLFEKAYGLAHRGYGIENTVDTRFAIGSGTKGLTALVAVSLIVDGVLKPETSAREWLREDLPRIEDGVTVEQLLAHTSGIGDYCDEDDQAEINEYHPPRPPYELITTEDYVPVLGRPTQYPPGERFRYNNGAFVVLAVIAERAAGIPFAELVRTRVTEPAGMADTAFLRSDELPARTAVGYLSPTRTNVFALPAVGSGDGGIYSTAPDFSAFWNALHAGRIVPAEWVSRMTSVVSEDCDTTEGDRYGLGFWLPANGDTVMLQGYDAGVSFRSVHNPSSGLTHTVVGNTADGAWPLTRWLSRYFLTKP